MSDKEDVTIRAARAEQLTDQQFAQWRSQQHGIEEPRMSDKEDVTIRAARAQQLLDDEVFNEAMDAVLDQALSAALRAVMSDPTECVAAIANLQAAHYLQETLRSFVTAGKAAERKPYKVA